MTQELKDLLESSTQLRRALTQVLPQEAVDYIMELIVKDGAYRKFLELTERD